MQLKNFLDPLCEYLHLKERKLTNNASKRSTVQVKDFYASSIKNWILPWEYFFPHVSIQKERKNKKNSISSRVWTENYWQSRIISLSSSQWFLFVVDILIKNAWATRFLLELSFKITIYLINLNSEVQILDSNFCFHIRCLSFS